MIASIKFTNTRGESVAFNQSGSSFHASNINGLGDVDVDIQSQKAPYQDGSTIVDGILAERAISFEVLIRGADSTDISNKRSQLSRILNPKLGEGILEATYGNVTRVINAISDTLPTFPGGIENRSIHHQIGLINLICPNPYWRSQEEHVEQLVTFSGGLTFPLVLPTIFGNQKSDAKSRIIVNDGDSSTPLEVTFEGPATSPIRIENETTGKFIEVAQSLLAGEKLWISTAFGKKRVEKIAIDGNRTNAFNYINLASTFFQLDPGNNLLTYSTGEDYEKAPVTIKFYSRYLAV